ncbi:hypothetical protein [Rosenbergiella epipactidis]|uniref:hypothetical protein n=1 Tax=Rosenbergiella epipactidis TaxID=1544694 RepID=UPI001F4D6A0D|nr:hypothetical protein [Rosenbergiella epipactidis]
MNIKSPSLQEFTLVILGKDRLPIRQKIFDSQDFILPIAQIGSSRNIPKTRKEKMGAWATTPLSEEDRVICGLMHQKDPFDYLAKVIDTFQLTLSIPDKGIKAKVKAFREAALKVAPKGTKINVAFETYMKEQYGHSYTDLINDARNKVIARFNDAFAENLNHDRMNDEYRADEKIFLHRPVWTSNDTINEYKLLAKQGHVYSQYLAGVFLASNAGGYKTECIEYLLMAYENKHPEAMRVLAEFLHFKEDYYGAAQCDLLSIHGGDDYSKKIFREVLGNTSELIVQVSHGLAPISYVIMETLRANRFNSILMEHFSEFNPAPLPEIYTPDFIQRGNHE